MRAALVLLALSAACARRVVPEARAAEAPGVPVPLEAQRFPGGEPYALSQDLGKIVLVDVWATWCEPCRETLPLYQRLDASHGSRGLRVYALSVDADPRGIPAFLDELQVKLPVLLDPEGRAAENVLHLQRVPSTYLFDRRGALRHVHTGVGLQLESEVRAQVEALLAEPAP